MDSLGIPCQVCENPKAVKKYNAYVCHACWEFFYRHYPAKKVPCCPYNCEISYKKRGRNCTECRLKKCLDLNMYRAEERQNVVNKLYLSYNTNASINKLMQMYGEITNNGFKIIGSLKDCQRVADFVDALAHFEGRLLAHGGSSPSSVVANTNISLSDLLVFPGACIDRSTTVCDGLSSTNSPISYKLMETILRIIVAAIENMALVEEFHLLPTVDKMKLVQQNAMMMSTCVLHFIGYSRGWDAETFGRYLHRFRVSGGAASFWNKFIAISTSPANAPMNEIMEEIRPTEKELLLLRLRSFFRPCVDHTEEGQVIIARIRLKLAGHLGEYIRETRPSLSNYQVQRRLWRMLELENLLKDPTAEVVSTLQALTSQAFNGFGTPLLHDIFIRNF